MKPVAVLLLSLFITAAAAGGDLQRVELRILDGNAPQTGVFVRVKHADAERTNGTTLELVSNDQGIVAFDVPTTVFWVTVPDLNDQVVGKEYRFAKIEKNVKKFDLRPRLWTRETGVSR